MNLIKTKGRKKWMVDSQIVFWERLNVGGAFFPQKFSRIFEYLNILLCKSCLFCVFFFSIMWHECMISVVTLTGVFEV